MAQYALPDSDVFLGTDWSECSGNSNGEIWDELDEGFGAGRGSGSGPDDGTTAWTSKTTPTRQVADTIEVTLSDVSDPGVSTGHIIRIRVVRMRSCSGFSSGAEPSAIVTLKQGTTTIASFTASNITGSAWETREYTLTDTEADSITDYTDLRIELIADSPGGSGRALGLSAIEFECPDAGGGPITQNLDGSLSFAGNTIKSIQDLISGSISSVGNLINISDGPLLDHIETNVDVLASGTNSLDVTLGTALTDTSRALLLYQVRANSSSSNPSDITIGGRILDANTLRFNRYATATFDVSIRWYVIEFTSGSGVSVQRGQIIDFDDNDNPITINNVDTSKSFAIINTFNDGSNFNADDFYRAEITNSTELNVTAQTFTSTGITLNWQVVEFSGANVQSANISFLSTDATKSDNVTSVDTTRSLLIFSHTSESGTSSDIGQKHIRGEITDSTTVTFTRENTGTAIELYYYLIEFPSSVRVQHDVANFTTTDLQKDITINSLDTSKSAAFISGTFNKLGSNTYNTDDELFFASPTTEFTTSTNLRLQRDITRSTAINVSWFTIEFDISGVITKLVSGLLSSSGGITKDVEKLLLAVLSSTGNTSKDILSKIVGAINLSGTLENLKTVFRTFSGSLSLLGNLKKRIESLLEGSVSMIGDLLKLIEKIVDAILDLIGIIIGRPRKTLSGQTSPVGTLINLIERAISGVISSAGNLKNNTLKTFQAVLSFIGNISINIAKIISGSINSSGVLDNIKAVLLNIAGSLDFSANVLKVTEKVLSSSLSFIGSLFKNITKLFSGILNNSANIIIDTIKILSGIINSSGTLNLIKVVVQTITAILTSSGNLAKEIKTQFTGNLNSVGNIFNLVSKLASAFLNFTAEVTNFISKVISGELSPTGFLENVIPLQEVLVSGILNITGTSRNLTEKLFSGIINSSGALFKRIQFIFTGILSLVGSLSNILAKLIDISGNISPSGDIIKILNKAISGVINSTSILVKDISRLYQGSISFIGNLIKSITQSLSGLLSLEGLLNITKLSLILIEGTLNILGSITNSAKKIISGSIELVGTVIKYIARKLQSALSIVGSIFKSISLDLFSSISLSSILSVTSDVFTITSKVFIKGIFQLKEYSESIFQLKEDQEGNFIDKEDLEGEL